MDTPLVAVGLALLVCLNGLLVWNGVTRMATAYLAKPSLSPTSITAPVDHTADYLQLVRDAMATVERIAAPVVYSGNAPDEVPPPQQFDMDALDPTDTTPWLLNMPWEARDSTVNVAPEPATHPMGIPGLEPPAHMQYTTDATRHPQPFDRYRVDVV